MAHYARAKDELDALEEALAAAYKREEQLKNRTSEVISEKIAGIKLVLEHFSDYVSSPRFFDIGDFQKRLSDLEAELIIVKEREEKQKQKAKAEQDLLKEIDHEEKWLDWLEALAGSKWFRLAQFIHPARDRISTLEAELAKLKGQEEFNSAPTDRVNEAFKKMGERIAKNIPRIIEESRANRAVDLNYLDYVTHNGDAFEVDSFELTNTDTPTSCVCGVRKVNLNITLTPIKKKQP